MVGSVVRVLLGAAVAVGVAWLLAAPARASEDGRCWASGYAAQASGGAGDIVDRGRRGDAGVSTADLTTVRLWRVRDGDAAVVEAAAPGKRRVSISAVLFGVPIPVQVSGSGSASTDAIETSLVSLLASRFGVSVQASPCEGAVVFESDHSPLLSAAGMGGLLLTFAGLLALMIVALDRSSRGGGARVARWTAGPLGGALAGAGAGLWLQEAGAISPLDGRALMVPGVGLLLGVVAVVAPAAARPLSRPMAGVPVAGPSLALGLTVLVLVAGFAPVGGGLSDQVLTSEQARTIALHAWAVARQAHSTHDTAPLEARFSDQGLEWARVRSQEADDYSRTVMAHALRIASVTVARGAGYPAWFFVDATVAAHVPTGASQTRIFLTFTHATPETGATAWMASGVDEEPVATRPPVFTRDDRGYAPPPTAAELAGLVMRPEEAVSAFGRYVTRSVAAGAPATASPFVSGRYSTGLVKNEVTYVRQEAQKHVGHTITYRSGDPLATLTYGGGAALVVATFERDDTATAIGPGCLVVSDHPQDSYTQVTMIATGVVLLEIPPRTAKRRSITVLGHDAYFSRTEYGPGC